MVAGESACHCDKCGMVCKGRFAGCTAVWERGPIYVPLGHLKVPAEALAKTENRPDSTGDPEHLEVAPVLVISPSAPGPAADTADLRPLIQALRAELQVLNRKIDQTWVLRREEPNEANRAAAQVMDAAENLPNRIVAALASALEIQHRAVMAEVRHAIAVGVPDAATTEQLIGLPERLASQLDELGDRVGFRLNDLSERIQELTDIRLAVESAERAPDDRNSAIMAEIDQLTRVVAGTIELLGQPALPDRLRAGRNGSKPVASEKSS
jgi:hypothetical protein